MIAYGNDGAMPSPYDQGRILHNDIINMPQELI